MYKGSSRFIFIFLIVVITGNNQLSAGGLGIYFPTLSVYSSGTTYLLESEYDDEADYDYAHFGGALFFDTNLAQDKVFHYRIALIYEKVEQEHLFGVQEFNHYALDHTFGFGIIRRSFVRLWVGPQVRLSFMNEYNRPNDQYREWRFGLGLKPVLGANFNFGKLISVCLDISYGAVIYYGKGSDDWDYLAVPTEILFNLGFALRFNDTFK